MPFPARDQGLRVRAGVDEREFRLQRLNFKQYITYTQGQALNISVECIIKINHLTDINNSFNIAAVAVVVQIFG